MFTFGIKADDDETSSSLIFSFKSLAIVVVTEVLSVRVLVSLLWIVVTAATVVAAPTTLLISSFTVVPVVPILVLLAVLLSVEFTTFSLMVTVLSTTFLVVAPMLSLMSLVFVTATFAAVVSDALSGLLIAVVFVAPVLLVLVFLPILLVP